VKLPFAVFPIASVAEQFTVVVAIEKVLPDAGAHVTVGFAGLASVAVAVYVTTAPVGPVASAVILAGRLRAGGVVSQVTTFAVTPTLSCRVSVVPSLAAVPVASIRRLPLMAPRVDAVTVTVIVTVPELSEFPVWVPQLAGREMFPPPVALREAGEIAPTDTETVEPFVNVMFAPPCRRIATTTGLLVTEP
jgi:hypothetical protein